MEKTTKSDFVSFRGGASADFGLVLRSSAIFYYRTSPTFRTTLSFLNYWLLKRNLTVFICASVREMSGALIRREAVPMLPMQVINYRPDFLPETWEGSVEIEVFSLENLVIPYAAIMAVYESPRGISMVHSYARAYSRHEVEERRVISRGEEGCWTIRDEPGIRSFGVIHNGPKAVPAQQCGLVARNSNGKSISTGILLDALAPYATVILRPGDHLPELASFLNGQPGQCSVSFEVGEAFTRMLVGNERADDTDFQVTHSNFNYAVQRTDFADAPGQAAFMRLPDTRRSGKAAIVYPHSSPGHYTLNYCGRSIEFSSGDTLRIDVPRGSDALVFRRVDGVMPTRLVTGVITECPDGLIENECSLGVVTHLRPRKRFWWGSVAVDSARQTALFACDTPEVYGGIPAGSPIHLSLYSSTGGSPLTAKLTGSDMSRLSTGIDFAELFPRAHQHLNGDLGYFTLFHEYGGLMCFSALSNSVGSYSLEHGF